MKKYGVQTRKRKLKAFELNEERRSESHNQNYESSRIEDVSSENNIPDHHLYSNGHEREIVYDNTKTDNRLFGGYNVFSDSNIPINTIYRNPQDNVLKQEYPVRTAQNFGASLQVMDNDESTPMDLTSQNLHRQSINSIIYNSSIVSPSPLISDVKNEVVESSSKRDQLERQVYQNELQIAKGRLEEGTSQVEKLSTNACRQHLQSNTNSYLGSQSYPVNINKLVKFATNNPDVKHEIFPSHACKSKGTNKFGDVNIDGASDGAIISGVEHCNVDRGDIIDSCSIGDSSGNIGDGGEYSNHGSGVGNVVGTIRGVALRSIRDLADDAARIIPNDISIGELLNSSNRDDVTSFPRNDESSRLFTKRQTLFPRAYSVTE